MALLHKMEMGRSHSETPHRRVVQIRPWSYNVLVPFSSGFQNLFRPMLSRNLFSDRLRLQELQQVIRSARL